MRSKLKQNDNICPREEVFAYIDCELSAEDELDMEGHFAECATCREELNSQKKVSTTLEILLEEESRNIELPKDFTKVVTAKAESNVSGLRHRKERSHALFICMILFLIIIVGLGAEVTSVLRATGEFGDQFYAVFGFVFRLIYDIGIGVAVILKSFGHRIVVSSVASLFLLIVIFVSISLSLSRLVLRYSRS